MTKRIPVTAMVSLVLLVSASGCGTILSQHIGQKGKTIVPNQEEYKRETCGIGAPNVYSGMAFDARAILAPFKCKGGGESGLAYLAFYPIILPLCLIDLPLSLAADTLILPYTIYRQSKYGSMVEIQK